MKVSCNGCRVLRKGCSKSCIIRPCLAWIQSPEAQGHATVFLAKFYGRTGLLNLINSGPDHLRPSIFKSLLYEACGRIVNPIYGSVGLLSSNNWPMVEAAVDAVLKGKPIVSVSLNDAADVPVMHPTCGIRHLSKGTDTGPDSELHKVSKTMLTRFKRTHKVARAAQREPQHAHETEMSHNSSNESPIEPICSGTQREVSVDTVDAASHVSQGEPGSVTEHEDMVLDLTLGFGFEPASSKPTERCHSSSTGSNDACSLSLELQLSV